MIKKLFLTLLPLLFGICAVAEEISPKANPQAEVVMGNARFTVLTPRLVRMEWAADGKFEDKASLGIVNRNLPVPAFKVSKSSRKLTIKTAALTLSYNATGKFDEKNLSIVFTMQDTGSKKGVKKLSWHPGMDDSANLQGTARTLDRFDGEHYKDPWDKGVVSRDGWAVIDESERHLLEPVDSDWKYWVAERPEGERQDLYFFGYGHDYMAALSDFTKISGRIPLPPKYAFGYWWCRYWQYSDYEFLDLAEHFKRYSIPIDVMIIDMDWHETWSDLKRKMKRDFAGERVGWTGYTWKKELFPNPENFIRELHDMDIKTSLNLHLNSGMQPYEEPYKRFRTDYLSRTSDYDGPKDYMNPDGSDAYIPFRPDQQEWADAYFNSVIRPLEKQGVDFWWLDWQQWRTSRYIKNLSNTFWLNYTFFNDKLRQSESLGKEAPRPMIYHRWGGIGSHRYQVGFSGDAYATWKVLSKLPYFTATASNVGYGYWGHDIGGHMQPKGTEFTDPELYTRWLQSGVFTPIFKTHSTKDASMEKRFWVFPEHFDPMQEAIRLRYSLSPYIYGAAREAYDTGVSICRPLYYYYPENENAYTRQEEFFFGNDILATVVCEKADETTGLATREIWFPEGNDWYDAASGAMFRGGTIANLQYTINENPYYIKAGAVLPWASPNITSLKQNTNEIWLLVAPGDGSSEAVLYEDDGVSQAYENDFATTKVKKISDPSSLRLTVEPRTGDFKGALPTRLVRIRLEGVFAPARVKVNGEELSYSRFAKKEAAAGKAVWGYEGSELAAVIYLAESAVGETLNIECNYNENYAAHRALLYGKKGLIKRMMNMTPEAKLVFEKFAHDYQLPSSFLNIAQCGSYITEDPANALNYLGQIDVNAFIEEFNAIKEMPQSFKDKAYSQTK